MGSVGYDDTAFTPKLRKGLLQRGDVFVLEVGQKVYMRTRGLSDCEVVCGEATSHQEYKRDKVVVGGKEYFSEPELREVKHPVPKPGNYRVVRTEYSGGGTGHGPHDIFPDGHKVFAQPVGKDSPTISFYQTGCFTAMIENPKIVKRDHKIPNKRV